MPSTSNVPEYQEYFLPLLEALRDGKTRNLSELMDMLKGFFHLSDNDLVQRETNGNKSLFEHRVIWAQKRLLEEGFMDSPAIDIFCITDSGKTLLQDESASKKGILNIHFDEKEHALSPENDSIDKYLESPEFYTPPLLRSKPKPRDALEPNALPTQSLTSHLSDTSNMLTPEEQLEQAYSHIHQNLRDELLRRLLQGSPAFFEQVVVDLMIAMNYGGSRKEAGKATKVTADDGIDGIIKEDRLGLDMIYLQAKRWVNPIHRPEIDKFIGALTRKGARKGVFITTSRFSSGARAAVENLNTSIALIDGEQLTELMVEHNLGVQTKHVYTLKQLDANYFDVKY